MRDELKKERVVTFSMGYDNKLYILTMYEKDIVKYGTPNDKYNAPHANHSNDYIVYIVSGSQAERYIIPKQKPNYYIIQPLPNNELLLGNAYIVGMDGNLKKSIDLGYYVARLQTTSIGHIWTSYHDQAYGETIGNVDIVGLHRWDKDGNEVYHYYPPAGVVSIFACYAMNAVSDNEMWVYYYTTFPLVKIVDDRVVDYWYPPIKYSHGFAIYNNHVVFIGKHDDKQLHHYQLLSDHQLEHIQSFELDMWGYYRYAIRGKTIVICENNQFYRFDVPELLRRQTT